MKTMFNDRNNNNKEKLQDDVLKIIKVFCDQDIQDQQVKFSNAQFSNNTQE